MRGKDIAQGSGYANTRITPAYAGKRLNSINISPQWKDHPRVCGEKQRIVKPMWKEKGSPPRMRGKVPFWLFWISAGGITPAHAGKSKEKEMSLYKL